MVHAESYKFFWYSQSFMGVLCKWRKGLMFSGLCMHVFPKLILYLSIILIFQKLFEKTK